MFYKNTGKIFYLLLFFFILNILFLISKTGISSEVYDKNHIAAKWEKIEITLFNKFNPEKPNKILLIRPAGYASKHGLINGNSIKTRLNEIGFPDGGSKVISIIRLAYFHSGSAPSGILNSNPMPDSSRVTGIYVHETNEVYTWRFENDKGNIELIHATPNHPFYVKNLKSFLPLKKIQPGMELTDDQRHIIHLRCPPGRHKNCGTPYNPGKIITVYNIEVAGEHQYFVSNTHILVHNCNRFSQPDSQDEVTAYKHDKLIIGCGSKGRSPRYEECFHTDIDTLDIDPEANATYSSLNEVPWHKYNKVLMERTVSSIKMDLSGKLNPGTEVYELLGGFVDSPAFKVKQIGELTFNELMEPEDGYRLLKEFGAIRPDDLSGRDFFITDKNTANAALTVRIKNIRAGISQPERHYLLKYTHD